MGITASAPDFPGAIIGPDDPRYPALSTGFNQRFPGRPAYIQLCGTPQQVVNAVQTALARELRITVRGGGHCYEGFVSDNPGGLIIDLSPLSAVYRDDTMDGAYCIEGGCTLWNVYETLYKQYGVTIPGGSCYSVGAGGHVCGGGYGLLSRRDGLTVDHLYAVEVVCVDAQRRTSFVLARKDDPNAALRDLFWAHTGGGGGNFGVVTRYWFSPSLPRAPRTAYLGALAWDWAGMTKPMFAAIVRNYGEFFARHSEPGDYGNLFTLMHLVQNTSGAQIAIEMQSVDEQAPVDDFIAAMRNGVIAAPVPLRTALPQRHSMQMTEPYRAMPWIEATQTLNGSGNNQRGKYKSAYMTQPFPSDQIDAIWSALNEPLAGSQALLQVDSYGGQVNAVGPDDTAVAQRSSIMKLQYQIYWTDPAQDAENLAWIRAFYESVYAKTGGVPVKDGTVTDGCFVNYCDTDLADWPTLYCGRNGYARLAATKKMWDPNDIFHHAQSIGSA